MRKLLVVILALLFLLSSCGYTVDDINAMQEKYDEEYNALEDQYYEAAGRVDDLEMILSRIDENYATAYCYYDDADPDVTEEQAHDALLKIGDLLREAGY